MADCRRKYPLRALPVLVLIGLLAGCGTTARSPIPVAPASSPRHPLPGHHLETVFLIVMENHNWSSIAGNPSAPYINGTLLHQASYARQYYNPPGLHPSLPNYLWLEAGTNCFPDTGCIRDDGDPSTHAMRSHAHLVALLDRAGISWRAYEENINGTDCPLQSHALGRIAAENGVPGIDGDLYTPRHDPFLYFDDVTNDTSSSSPVCIQHVRPFTQLAGDLRHNTVAGYNVIAPNLCDDMHDACPVLSDRIKQGDRWLSRVVPAIQASDAYRHGGVLFITWDEGVGSDGPIGLIVLSPDARGHGYSTMIHYTHSSTLRTIEEIFGVHPLLGGAAHATDLRALFRRFP